jgi:glycine cleavage system T protein (aminomethyltransferase)
MKNQELLRKEHETVRNKVGFFDFAHDILEVTGKDAKCFLDYICVNVISDLEKNNASYTTILNKDAEALDDVIVFYHGGEKYWISTLFIDELLKWLNQHKGDRDVEFKDITDQTSLYSVQGPNSRKVLNDILKDNIDDLKYFEFKNTKIDDIDVIVSRTGFTGELGFELYFHPKYTDRIVKELKEKGEAYGIREITTDVTLTSLPTEKGYITVDDFKGADPIELGLEWSVECEKDFIGKAILCKLKEEANGLYSGRP